MSANPYVLGPVKDPRLLASRRGQISKAVETLTQDEHGAPHVLLLGEDRSGRTSVIQEVERRLSSEHGALVVRLRLDDSDLSTSGIGRALLSAAIEATVSEMSETPDWYRAWADRVYLRDRSPLSSRDLLICGAALAADPSTLVDRSVWIRDLNTLGRVVDSQGFKRIVVTIDTADDLLEDTDLTDLLISSLDAAGWKVAMTSKYSGAKHLADAVSPSLRRCTRIGLTPLWTPSEIRACFTVPLGPKQTDLMPKDDGPFLFDVLWLTSGNPFEIALVARHLWLACQLGEQEHYELTDTVLDRVLQDLVLYTGASRDLLAGAEAVRSLPPERMAAALDLVALSEMTARQVAIARSLGLPNPDDHLDKRLLAADLDEEEAGVLNELAELEQLGVVALGEEGTFTVQGGRRSMMALKYRARSLARTDSGDRPFGLPFLVCVGGPMTKACAVSAVAATEGAARLAWGLSLTASTAATGARLRAALDAEPFVGIEVDPIPMDSAAAERISEMITSESTASLAVVNCTISSDGEDFNRVEIWEMPPACDGHELNQTLHDVVETLRPLIDASEMTWKGVHAVDFCDAGAKAALIHLFPGIATGAVYERFNAWRETGCSEQPDDALRLAESIAAAHRNHRPGEGWQLSIANSHLGFFLSMYPERLEDAQAVLEHAIARGDGDGWVTKWNLANVAAQRGDYAEARRVLVESTKEIEDGSGHANLSFFVPSEPARATLIEVTPASKAGVRDLQIALFSYLLQQNDVTDVAVRLAADVCTSTNDPAGGLAASWALAALGAPAQQAS
jgi:hypothetical protein